MVKTEFKHMKVSATKKNQLQAQSFVISAYYATYSHLNKVYSSQV